MTSKEPAGWNPCHRTGELGGVTAPPVLAQIGSIGKAGGEVGHGGNALRVGLCIVVGLVQVMAAEEVDHQIGSWAALELGLPFAYRLGEVARAQQRYGGAAEVLRKVLRLLREEADQLVVRRKLIRTLDGLVREASICRNG